MFISVCVPTVLKVSQAQILCNFKKSNRGLPQWSVAGTLCAPEWDPDLVPGVRVDPRVYAGVCMSQQNQRSCMAWLGPSTAK